MEIALSASKNFSDLRGVFFNSADSRFFVVNAKEVVLCYESTWLHEFDINEDPSHCLKLACVSPNNAFLAYASQDNEIAVFSHASKEVKIVKGAKNKKIKGLVLVTGRLSLCDLVVVTEASIEFYKISERPLKVSLLKSYSVSVSNFWYEASEGVLVVNLQNSNEFIPFFLFQNKGYKYFQGTGFCVKRKNEDFDFVPSRISENLMDCEVMPLDKTQVLVSKIYESVYLLSFDGLFGQLVLFKIEIEGYSTKFMEIKVKPGGYSLRISDNLIVIHNYGPQESSIFDIKREKEKESCMVLVKHRGYLSEDSYNYQVFYQSEVDPHLAVVGDSFYYEMQQTKIYTLKIDPEILLNTYQDHIEKILFTLRRDHCLQVALSMLRDSLEVKISPIQLNNFFNITNHVYKETAIERKNQKTEEKNDRNSISKKQSRTTENQLKSSSGMTILLQYDVYVNVFEPYYKSKKDYFYLSQVLITYISSLVRQELHVHPSHQYLLTKTLIKVNQYKLLQNLFQYQMLGNDEKLAKFICSVENGREKYPQIFNLGVDILHRLRKYSDLVLILAKKGDIYEALGIVAGCQDSYDFGELKRIVSDYADEEMKSFSLEMIEAYAISEKKNASY